MNESDYIHRFSDVDSSWRAQHHTLGPGKNQASPGDHTHDGITSRAINAGGEWTDFTSNFGNAFAGFNIGNGSLVARYMEANGLIYIYVDVVMGSTTTYGSGFFYFQLPVAAESGRYFAFSAALYDRGTFLEKLIGAVAYTANNVKLIQESGDVTSTSPATMQNFSRLTVQGWYIGAA